MRFPKLRKNLYYHIYNRAVSKQLIFKDDTDYRFFMYKIGFFKKVHRIEIVIYCILPNHFHLLLKSDHDPESISKFMQSIQKSYAQYFNKKYKHSGHVFESRFCHKEIITNSGLYKVKKYILNNPVEAGLVNKYYEWPYYWICQYL
jgi:REP element-mobilizing transposase RayT